MLAGGLRLRIPSHRVVVAPGRVGRGTVSAGEVVRLKDLLDLPAVLRGQLREVVSRTQGSVNRSINTNAK
ncbi:hypothetical protein GCM10020367_63370 [Streptomyces sannanensis]|uniref:Uncharacterized protein n=1 Tax=Streptomyces sannanensis TaxID=285536 RepID=A0ABP6SLJ5_9ACTN